MSDAAAATADRGASPPPIGTRRVELRIVTVADYPFLYRAATSPAASFRWRYRGATPAPEQFAHDLWQGVLAQYLVVSRDSGAPLGLVSAYQADLANGSCYLAMLGDPEQTPSGAVLEAAGLFISYLFHTWNLRQIYAEVPGYTLDSFGSGLGRYFVQEGRLVDHSYHDGRYWDLHLLAIHRADWDKTGEPVVRSLTREAGP